LVSSKLAVCEVFQPLLSPLGFLDYPQMFVDEAYTDPGSFGDLILADSDTGLALQ